MSHNNPKCAKHDPEPNLQRASNALCVMAGFLHFSKLSHVTDHVVAMCTDFGCAEVYNPKTHRVVASHPPLVQVLHKIRRQLLANLINCIVLIVMTVTDTSMSLHLQRISRAPMPPNLDTSMLLHLSRASRAPCLHTSMSLHLQRVSRARNLHTFVSLHLQRDSRALCLHASIRPYHYTFSAFRELNASISL